MPAHERTFVTDHVLIISGSVGAGHNGAAAELAARLRERDISVEIRDRTLPSSEPAASSAGRSSVVPVIKRRYLRTSARHPIHIKRSSTGAAVHYP